MNKYEKLIEHIINDETDKARALFHNIVVEKSRDIYESLIGDEDLNEVGGNEVQDLRNDVAIDEQGISEEEDDAEFAFDNAEDDTADLDQDDVEGSEFGAGDDVEPAEGDVEDRVESLEDALDALKAEFDALVAGEEGEAEHAGDDFGTDGDFETDDLDDTVDFGDESGDEFEESIVREYVEKVAQPNNRTEGGEVGKGGTATINKNSNWAGKNDMGGSAKNLNQGKSEGSAPNAPQKANNYGTKGQTEQPLASRNLNVPGGKAGNAFKSKEKPKAGEGQTTDGKVSVDKNSPLKAR